MVLTPTGRTLGQTNTIAGTFKYVNGSEDEIIGAIERAIKPLPELPLVKDRDEARRQLRLLEKPYERLVLNCSAQRIEITLGQNDTIRSLPDGRAIKLKRRVDSNDPLRSLRSAHSSTGRKDKRRRPKILTREFDVKSSWKDGMLIQEIGEPKGKSIRKYRLTPDGNTLNVVVTISGGHLGFNLKPHTFTLIYKREQ